MSAPAVKPALPAAGAQTPKVGSGAPSANPNNPPPPITGGSKVLPTTGSPNRPLAPPNANHATVAAVPLSLVQEHKGGGGLNQQPPPVNRTPEKQVASTVGIKPTSNGVEGSPNRPLTTAPPAEVKKTDEGSAGTAIMNHSADIAATPSQPQPSPHTPLVSGTQSSPVKPQVAPVSPSTTNHSTLVSATNKLETAVAEIKPPASLGAVQSPEPLPAPVQQQAPALTQQTQQQSVVPQQQQPPLLTQQPSQQQQQQQQAPQQIQQQQPQAKPAPAPTPQATPQPAAQVPPQIQPSSTPPQQNLPAAPVQSQTVTPPTQEPPAKPAAPTIESTKTRTEAPPKPEFKVATPPRNSKRKREVKPPAEPASAGSTKTSASSEQDDRKSKRVRTQTQPYQSPLPELTYIAKLKTLMKSPDDKLIVFYKNEFLAVRNAEGSFYICQAMQNIYKSSPRIRIRWLSQEKKDNKSSDVYIPDFYDATDFDCILTNLELKRLDKNKYQLPEEERERTQSILKRALDVEKGVSEKPPVTEEHPDGLDLSLFRDESQLKKRRSLKRSAPRKKGKENASSIEDGYEGLTGDESEEEELKKKKPKQSKKVEKPKEKVKTKEKPVEKKAERVSERGRDRSLAAKRRSESTAAAAAAAAAKNAAVKQTVAKHAVAKTAERKSKALVRQTPKKPEPAVESSIPTRSTKTRSVKVTSQPKSSPVTRTKERERRGTVLAKGRKKPGKKA